MLKSILLQLVKNNLNKHIKKETMHKFSDKFYQYSKGQENDILDLDAFHQKNYIENELKDLKFEKKLFKNKESNTNLVNSDHLTRGIEHMKNIVYIDPYSITQINRVYEQTKNIRQSCLSLDEKYELILEFNKSKIDSIFKEIEKDFTYKNTQEKTQEEQIDDFISFFGQKVNQINAELNHNYEIA